MKNAFNENRNNFEKKDINDVLENYNELNEKFEKNGKIKKFLSDFKLLFSMVRDYASGKYSEVPWYIIAAIGSSLLYVLSPIDLIPDFIPVIGYVDDAAIMAICLKFVHLEVEKYKKWKIKF